MHLLDDHADGITSDSTARKLWSEHPWQIAIVTVLFDVVDLPGTHGSTIHHRLKTRCPTAIARPGRRLDWMIEPGPVRWHFYVTPGTVDPDKVVANDGTLHTGHNWIPAPPSRTPDTGRVGWIVPPDQSRWQTYRRTDIFDTLGLA